MREDIDTEYFRKRLEERLAAIMAGQEAKKGEAPVELDQTRVGHLSRMDALQQQALAQVAGQLAEQERQRIEAALKRIESGEYDWCVLCGEEIGEGRLRFDPSVLTCIECARTAEARWEMEAMAVAVGSGTICGNIPRARRTPSLALIRVS